MLRTLAAFGVVSIAGFGSTAHAAIEISTMDGTNSIIVSNTGAAAGQEIVVTNEQRQIYLKSLFDPVPGGGRQSLTVSQFSLELNDDTQFLRTAFVQGQGDLLLLGSSAPGFTIAADQPTFLGSIAIDLSGFASSLQSPGYVGDINYFDGTQETTIGQYVVVPEPHSLALLGLGGLLIGAGRRRG